MATTFQVNENEQNDFQKTFADTLLSKLNIDSKFFNEIAERVVNLANKNLQSSPIKQTQQSTSQSQTKEKETPKSAPVQNENKSQTSNKQTVNKTENLNANKNLFQVVDPSKPQIKLPEQDTSKQDSLFGKFTSMLEKTTDRLEQTVKKVPRPWELTPGTSMGYQMLTGKEPIGERARKGLAQFMGRYVTNIKEPRDYSTNLRDVIPFPQHIKSILTDKPEWLENKSPTTFEKEILPARDILYRELFDLPSRKETTGIKKTGEKEYQLRDIPQPQPKELISPNVMKAYLEGKLKQNQIDELKKRKPKPHTVNHPLMGQTYLTPTTDGKFSYSDVWDLVSPGDKDKKDLVTKLRHITAPLLRPATVKGKTYNTKKSDSFLDSDSKNIISEQLSDDLSKEVSTKLEKMPVLSSLTKGIENIKGNKMVEGLKEISSVAPSVKPIVSFLTTNETSIKPKSTIELTDSKSFNGLKDWMKETTVSKLNNWSTDLYDWSKEKISGFTKSMDTVFTGTEKLNPIKSDSFKIDQTPYGINKPQETKNPLEGFDIDSLKSLAKGVQPDTPSLQDKIGKENLMLNNGALEQIVGNTKATNEAMKTLGGAILRLAQTFNNNSKGNQNSNLYAAAGGQNSITASKQRADIMGGIASVSQLAATNNDTIKGVRNKFWPQWGQLKPQWAQLG